MPSGVGVLVAQLGGLPGQLDEDRGAGDVGEMTVESFMRSSERFA